MLANLIQETANSPGTAIDVVLLGAVPGRRAFGNKFGSGAAVFYGMTDGVMWEVGIGTVTSASPAKLSRTTVLDNSAGTTSRLNFVGTVVIYNDLPAEYTPYLVAGKLPTTIMPQPLISQLFSGTAASVPHNTATTMTWDALGTNTLGAGGGGGFTVPSDGFYRATLNLSATTGSGAGYCSASLIIGGTERTAPLLANNLGRVDLSCSFEAPLTAGTAIQASVFQTSGGVVQAGGSPRSNFSLVRLG